MQTINEIADLSRSPAEEKMESWAIKLLDVLSFCARNNKAIHLMRSRHFNEDLTIKSITRLVQFLANSNTIQKKWDDELDKYKLLPNFPNSKGNFLLCDAEISTKEDDVIYYNAYTACPHANSPRDNCLVSGMKNMRQRKSFITNLFCR